MAPALTHQPTRMPDDYDRLPMAIKQYYSRSEYLWLTESQKAELQRTETEPDPE